MLTSSSSSEITTSLLPTLLAALQASLSVLLVLLYGALSAHLSLLSPSTGKALSKLCVKIFLPALLLTKIGSELHSGSAHRYVIILLWAIVCHFVSFVIGVLAHWGLGMQDWVTAAVMFNNTTSYPLLLIQSLDETGILEGLLVVKGEGTREAIERAKSYFLVFATVSSCLTFAVGPRLIDSEHAPDEEDDDRKESNDDGDSDDANGNGHSNRYQYQENLLQPREHGQDGRPASPSYPTERSSLLQPSSAQSQTQQQQSRRASSAPNSFFPSLNRNTDHPEPSSQEPGFESARRPSVIPKNHWLTLTPRIQWWLLFLYDFINTPLIGALLGAFIGLIPSLHRAFFADTKDGGIFTAWLTASLKSIGGLFVPLPVVVAGGSLYACLAEMIRARRRRAEGREERGDRGGERTKGGGGGGESTEVLTTVFVLVVRFVIWPAVSIATIYWLAKKTAWLGDDPMLWFAMMLMPTGPPAMKLITMVQVSYANEEEEHKIAKLLTISYAISPILAFTVVGAFTASRAAIESQ